MEILLVAATRQEIAAFIDQNPSIDHLIAGVGIPATIYHLQKKLAEKKYDLVVQAGIAGSYHPDLPTRSIAIVMQDSFGDLGMEEKEQFTSIFDSGFTDGNAFPYSQGWLANPAEWFHQLGLPLVKGITVNKVSDSPVQKTQIRDRFAPEVESMEGAAFHFVCLMEHIPFLQVRSISNEAGVRDRSRWDIPGAIKNLDFALGGIVRAANKAHLAQTLSPLLPTRTPQL